MSKNTTANLAGQLQQKQNASSSLQQNLSGLQSELNNAQNSSSQAINQATHLQATQDSSGHQLQTQNNIFGALTHLLDQYRESKNITIDPNIVITKTISAEELASTDILKEACKSQFQEGFDVALAKITNLDFQDNDGKTILIHAIINGFYYGVDKLLQKGANVNLVDKQGANALIYSAQNPHIKYTKQIAKKVADISLKAENLGGGNALHLLLLNGSKIIFASELNGELNGAVNQNSLLVLDENYELPSGWAGNIKFGGANLTLTLGGKVSSVQPISVNEKTIRLAKYLVEKRGIDISNQDKEGNTPLLLAAKAILTDVVDLLLNTCNVADQPNKQGIKAWDVATYNSMQSLIDLFTSKNHIDPEAVKLWTAARRGEAATVEQQIKKGVHPDVTIENYGETTALIQAIISGNLPTVTTILNSKADVNKPDKDLVSPLYYSLGYGGQPIQPTIVKFLVNEGANVNQPMNDGDTPLHMSSYKACVGAIKLLLEHGAKVDVTNNQGKTSLHVLIEQKGLEEGPKLIAVKYLLCKSASTTLKDGAGHNAIELAQNNFPEASNWLEHPETLPSLNIFEASIGGELSPWV